MTRIHMIVLLLAMAFACAAPVGGDPPGGADVLRPIKQPIALADPQPADWPSSMMLAAVIPNWLPPAEPMPQPRLLPGLDTASRPSNRPAVDSPPLAGVPLSRLPLSLPSYPLAWAPTPDVGDLLTLPRASRPDRAGATVAADPASEAANDLLLLNLVGQRAAVAPFVRLLIPSLFDRNAVPVRAEAQEHDGPVVQFPGGPAVVLPAVTE